MAFDNSILAPVGKGEFLGFGKFEIPLRYNTLGTSFPVIQIVWNIVTSLFTLAIFGFLIALLIGGAQYLFSLGNEEASAKAKKTFFNAMIGLVIVFGSYSLISYIMNQFGSAIENGNLANITASIYEFVLAISGAGFLVILATGGVRYLSSGGNEESTAKARKQITSGIIGIVLVAGAFAIGRIILKLLEII